MEIMGFYLKARESIVVIYYLEFYHKTRESMKVPLSKGVNDIQYRFIQKERIQ